MDVDVLALAVAAAVTNLNKENGKIEDFCSILFEGKYDGVLLIFNTIILILMQYHATCFSAPYASFLLKKPTSTSQKAES